MAHTRAHATSGTGLREPRPLSGQGLCFSLDRERQALNADLQRTSGGRAAKTLAKAGTLRVTMVTLKNGTTVEPEAVAGEASVQVVEGRISLQADGRVLELGRGDLAVLSRNLREPIRAVEDSTILVTVAWEEGAGAWQAEEREGRL